MNYTEVTKELFNKLVNSNDKTIDCEFLELCRKEYYSKYGCRLLVITNYINDISQYYINDINS